MTAPAALPPLSPDGRQQIWKQTFDRAKIVSTMVRKGCLESTGHTIRETISHIQKIRDTTLLSYRTWTSPVCHSGKAEWVHATL